jgi:signal transduction histidine kinase
MAFWNNPLLRKTAVFMLAGFLSLAAIVATSLWLTYKVQANRDEVIRERAIRTQAAALLGLATDAESGQRGFLLVDEAKYLEPYERAAPRIPEAVDRLLLLTQRTPRFHDAVQRLSALLKDKLAELEQTIALVRDGRRPEALEIVRSDRGKITMDQVRETIGSMITDSDRRVAALLEQGQEATTALFWVNTVSSLLILTLAIAAGWTVTRYTGELVEARRAVSAANLTLEARVRERTAALSRANEEIQRFAYIVSHDLRAPLVNIMGFTSELEASTQALQKFVSLAKPAAENDPLASEARTAADQDLPEAIGFIRASTSKMDRLINAILKLSREGRRELRPEPIELKTLFDGIAASVKHQVEQAGAKISIAPRLPTIVSDRLALEQIFGNLIDNAIKYLGRDKPGAIDVAASSNGERVTIEVADNGRGIAPSDHERIFELFRRAGAQDVPGEGIGLAHVRALVRRLDGDISVASQVGGGSRFHVTLPRAYVRRADQEQA